MAKRRLATRPWTNELSPWPKTMAICCSALAQSLDRAIVHSLGCRNRRREGRALGRRHHVRPGPSSISCRSIRLAPELQRVVSRELTMFPICPSSYNLRWRGSARF